MRHIYLSPHLDDAVLSCGGAMHGQIEAGARVVVINVFAGSPEYAAYSAYAQRQHRKWGGREGSMAIRLAEDRAVLTQLGATVENWDYPECIYRQGYDGRWLYDSHDAIFGEVDPGDEPVRVALAARLQQIAGDDAEGVIYAPLAVGHHVDHLLVRAVAMEMARTNPNIRFYEDFPYVAREPDALDRAMAEVAGVEWVASRVAIDVEAKMAAIAGYPSQIPALFGDVASMRRMVQDYARSLGHGNDAYWERYWSMRRTS